MMNPFPIPVVFPKIIFDEPATPLPNCCMVIAEKLLEVYLPIPILIQFAKRIFWRSNRCSWVPPGGRAPAGGA